MWNLLTQYNFSELFPIVCMSLGYTVNSGNSNLCREIIQQIQANKEFVRSTMSQEDYLVDFARLGPPKYCQKIDFETVIRKFAEKVQESSFVNQISLLSGLRYEHILICGCLPVAKVRRLPRFLF